MSSTEGHSRQPSRILLCYDIDTLLCATDYRMQSLLLSAVFLDPLPYLFHTLLQERASGVKANNWGWLQAAHVLPVGTTLLPTVSHAHGLNGTGIRATASSQQ